MSSHGGHTFLGSLPPSSGHSSEASSHLTAPIRTLSAVIPTAPCTLSPSKVQFPLSLVTFLSYAMALERRASALSSGSRAPLPLHSMPSSRGSSVSLPSAVPVATVVFCDTHKTLLAGDLSTASTSCARQPTSLLQPSDAIVASRPILATFCCARRPKPSIRNFQDSSSIQRVRSWERLDPTYPGGRLTGHSHEARAREIYHDVPTFVVSLITSSLPPRLFRKA